MYNLFHTPGIQKIQLYKNQVSIRSVLMLEFANKAFSFQIVGQIGSLMTPEDSRIVKVLLRRIRIFYTKKKEVGKIKSHCLSVPVIVMIVGIPKDRFEI